MNDTSFWILTALATGRQHGYAIRGDVEHASSGTVSLRITTLYASLERLEREGHIRTAGDDIVDGRARRYYEITDGGLETLTEETRLLDARVSAAKTRMAARAASGARATVVPSMRSAVIV